MFRQLAAAITPNVVLTALPTPLPGAGNVSRRSASYTVQ